MTRCFQKKSALWAVSAAVFVVSLGAPGYALNLYWPKQDQVVRENVKISIPGSVVPEDCFISVAVGEAGHENFVLAVNSESVRAKNGTINVFWNSKAPYRTISDPKNDHYFKDGKYVVKVDIHQQNQNSAKILDSASVPIILRNKIARPNPAPGVALVNKLSFGQMNTFDVSSSVQVFEVVAGVDLPIVGGLGMSGDFKVIQSVEDVRADGEFLLRYRLGEKPSVISFGQKTILYETESIKPQLYRLMTKYGNVTDRNMFSKQAKFQITDILPVLPKKSVKEGDSWPDKMSLKLEGLTDLIEFKGTCMLDSFEWQSGHECVKLISQMAGASGILLDDGRIRSSSNSVKAEVITYFDYKAGKTIRREVTLEFPAIIEPGAGEAGASAMTTATAGSTASSGNYASSPFGGDDEDSPAPQRRVATVASMPARGGSSGSTENSSVKRGKVQIRAAIAIEK
ncbi:MAG: hypothetical protein ABFD49_10080 [Armatimonadota bacterium]|nr:hypothetical protein [bacterium]